MSAIVWGPEYDCAPKCQASGARDREKIFFRPVPFFFFPPPCVRGAAHFLRARVPGPPAAALAFQSFALLGAADDDRDSATGPSQTAAGMAR